MRADRACAHVRVHRLRQLRWIGADGAYSIDLGGGRVLWVFGDTFIATSAARARSESKMIRNSLALQTGYDPTRAFMRFYWPETDGEPQSFRPEEGGNWFWPAHGIRLDDVLLVFYERLGTPPADPRGFANEGFSATLVTNPDDDPSRIGQANAFRKVKILGAVPDSCSPIVRAR